MKSAKHLEFVRMHPCMVCGIEGAIEAHHLLKPWQGPRGLALKAGDQNAVPLCPTHHRELHHYGDEFAYFEWVLQEPHAGKHRAMELWFKSPQYKEQR